MSQAVYDIDFDVQNAITHISNQVSTIEVNLISMAQ